VNPVTAAGPRCSTGVASGVGAALGAIDAGDGDRDRRPRRYSFGSRCSWSSILAAVTGGHGAVDDPHGAIERRTLFDGPCRFHATHFPKLPMGTVGGAFALRRPSTHVPISFRRDRSISRNTGRATADGKYRGRDLRSAALATLRREINASE
jgi:hypothetical protein